MKRQIGCSTELLILETRFKQDHSRHLKPQKVGGNGAAVGRVLSMAAMVVGLSSKGSMFKNFHKNNSLNEAGVDSATRKMQELHYNFECPSIHQLLKPVTIPERSSH